jgi:hypothetical protein
VRLLRRSSAAESDAATAAPETPTSGKGRPTPKRKEAQAQRKANVTAPRDKKEARARDREDRAQAYERMKAGDERYFPARDRGPARAYARNWVDGRRNVAQFFWPAIITGLVLLFLPGTRSVATTVLLVFYVVVAADTAMSLFGLRRQLAQRFPDDPSRKGALSYAFGRSMQSNKRKVPPATVSIGWTKQQRRGGD